MILADHKAPALAQLGAQKPTRLQRPLMPVPELSGLGGARAGRHLHVDDIPEVIEAIPEARISIIHVTRRTDLRAAKRALDRVVPKEDRDRVEFFMERPPRQAEHQAGVARKTPEPVDQSRE